MPNRSPHPQSPQTLVKPAVLAVVGGIGEVWLNSPTLPHFDTTAEVALPTITGFEILQELGRGGMGVVYKARDLSTNQIVAVKVLLSGAHASQMERERFRREMLAAATLRHPNVIQLLNAGEQQGLPYLVLEYVDGGTLADCLDGTPWSPTEAAELILLLAKTVQFAHEHDVLHRDLKPANILFSGETPKLADFGLSKSIVSESDSRPGTESGAVLGTPSYISPEQATGEHPVGPATDVYALGAILYELLTGRPPFDGKTTLDIILKVLNDTLVRPSTIVPELPNDLEAIVLKCLQKKPEQRYATAAELADDLQRFLSGEPVAAHPPTATRRLLTWFSRRPRLTTTGATAVLLFLMLSSWGFVSSATEHPNGSSNVTNLLTESSPTPSSFATPELKVVPSHTVRDCNLIADLLPCLAQLRETMKSCPAEKQLTPDALKIPEHSTTCIEPQCDLIAHPRPRL